MHLLRGTARLFFLAAWWALIPFAAYAQQASPAVTSPPASESSTRQTLAAEKYYALGVRAMEKGDVAAAEKAFAKAAKADPSNPNYSFDFQIARQHVITRLVQDADKARIQGHPEVARAKLAEALALDPKNPEVSQHVDDLANLTSTPPADDSITATIAPAIELTPTPGKHSFHLKSSEQEVLRRVLEAYGIKMVSDDSVSPKTVRFDADDVDYAQATKMASLVTDSFMVPLDPVRVLVAKDTKENRAKYVRLVAGNHSFAGPHAGRVY